VLGGARAAEKTKACWRSIRREVRISSSWTRRITFGIRNLPPSGHSLFLRQCPGRCADDRDARSQLGQKTLHAPECPAARSHNRSGQLSADGGANGPINEAVKHCRNVEPGWQADVRACLERVAQTEWGRLFIRETPAFQEIYDPSEATLQIRSE